MPGVPDKGQKGRLERSAGVCGWDGSRFAARCLAGARAALTGICRCFTLLMFVLRLQDFAGPAPLTYVGMAIRVSALPFLPREALIGVFSVFLFEKARKNRGMVLLNWVVSSKSNLLLK